jgi:alkanesulfonate monooxygenase SsuD/methylene tetrahydromethanopterin reductase-like flavin-dependent oxidoreductase (luciferase family)
MIATVMAADRDLASAEETVAMAANTAHAWHSRPMSPRRKCSLAMVAAAREKFGRIKVTHGDCICCNPSSSESWLLTMNTIIGRP